jgi:CheY-like chemotaxis protein
MSLLKWCDLVTVKDGREAVHCLQNQQFDGLIMAARIPHMDGFELIQCVRHSELNAGIPIVMLTGEEDVGVMRRGFKAGVTFFAIKPRSRESCLHLFNAVRGAMETRRRRHHRLPYRTPVTCILGDLGRSRFVGESMEISEAGMSVSPSGGVEVGQVLELEFVMPRVSRPAHPEAPKSRKAVSSEDDMPLTGPQKVPARVLNKTASGESLGLEFLGLTPKQREAIQQYIAGDI